MPISQLGALNTTALIVPNLYVQIVPPSVTLLNGVPTNVGGVVGTATWGPVNSPTIVSGMSDYAQKFGAIQARKYDMGTAVGAAVLQGAANFRCVRVTDGTDVAASVTILTNCLTLTGKYTGSLGNSLSAIIAAGTAANTTKVTLSLPGVASEVYDNIAGTGNALWVAIASAINAGQNGLRGPSQLVVASAGAGTTAPTLTSYTFTGGVDGATTITSAVLIGQDIVPRKGMYALRNSGCSVAMLVDADDSTQWTLQAQFGLSEGIYMQSVGPAGDTIANAIAVKASAGIDNYPIKIIFGDWIVWQDTVNGVQRLISPQSFFFGLLLNMAPNNSTLNKNLYGIIATQKSLANQFYSDAELQLLGQAGIDVITNPVPGGSYFGARFGHNTSSNAVINGDNYTRMTNYIASTINAGMGYVIGKPQTPKLRTGAKATLDAFLGALQDQGLIGTADGSPCYSVTLDNSNNLPTRVAQGYMQADVKVIYQSIVEKFLVNLEGGQSVTVTKQSTTPIAA